jgi:hypothetical protein
MEAESNYWVIWFIYLAAAAVFYSIFWRLTAFSRALWISYSLRAVAAAVILTPWYANSQTGILAPALMVVTLDAITMGSSAVGRALVPLLLGLLVAESFASVLYLIRKRSKRLEKQ